MRNLSELRIPEHINHFKEIHQIVLSKNWAERNMEHFLLMKYYNTLGIQDQRNELKSHEVKIYSQNGEDGLLLYIFSKIGVKNKKYINIGCGGRSSNTSNLVINFGWRGLDSDGNVDALRDAQEMIKEKVGKRVEECIFLHCWITRDNVNAIIKDAGFSGEIDLFSIDIDGNDYWIWAAIDVVKPRVAVIEYNAFFGSERSISVKYDPNFERSEKHPSGWYIGASLKALAKLGEQKGYALIGCESNGVNAFFVRKDLIKNRFIQMSPIDAFYPHFQRHSRITNEDLESLLNDMVYVEIK
jgi:hypothetical protein